MSSNREKLKKEAVSAFENGLKPAKPFGTFNPMQQERIITHMNTLGSKNEMRRFSESMKDSETGMMDTL